MGEGLVGSAAAIQPHAAARLNLRVPPGMDSKAAQDALIAQLTKVAPWGVGGGGGGGGGGRDVPDAEIVLLGVEEPACLIHAPNESVAPSEIENMAVTEALFLQRLGAAGSAPR